MRIGIHNSSRSEEHTSELQSRRDLVCRLLLEKNKLMPGLGRGQTGQTEQVLVVEHQPSAVRERHTVLLVPHLARVFFFFNETPTTEIYTLSLHDALPI